MSYILLIEDNEDYANMVQRILTSAGFTVKHVTHGSKGVQLARQEPPSLILMDSGLPDLNADVLPQLIKRQLGEKTPPIVSVSGRVSDADKEHARQVGCSAFLGKPFLPEDLLMVVKRFLGSNQVAPVQP